MPTAMMITNRNVQGKQLGLKRAQLRCYVSDSHQLRSLSDWEEISVADFRERLVGIASQDRKSVV